MEPMVHGSWSKEFLFYGSTHKKRKSFERPVVTLGEKVEVSTHPVKASGTLSHVGLGLCSGGVGSGQQDEVGEKHGGHAD